MAVSSVNCNAAEDHLGLRRINKFVVKHSFTLVLTALPHASPEASKSMLSLRTPQLGASAIGRLGSHAELIPAPLSVTAVSHRPIPSMDHWQRWICSKQPSGNSMRRDVQVAIA